MPFDGLADGRAEELDVLLRMRDALAAPGAWCRGISSGSNCLVTAARSMARTPGLAEAVICRIAAALPLPWNALPWTLVVSRQYRVIGFNDVIGRTQADILAVLDRAIAAG